MAGNDLEFRILGPLTVVRGDRRLRIGGRRQRALLAVLLVDAGRPVAADRLIDELWRGTAPAGASTLPSYISRLRAALEDSARVAVGPAGYTLQATDEEIDARRFEGLVAEGRKALAEGRARRAVERLRLALALWRGRPFGDLADDGALRVEADRLDEVRLLALEGRIDAELTTGGGVELVAELEMHVREFAFRERFWAQLMLALYRSNRQADALEAYQRARRTLRAELGLEPGPQLVELQRAILRQEVPAPRSAAAGQNLPAPLTTFVGRAAEVAETERLLEGARILTLTGVGGVGKTRLALEVAARAAPDLPGGARFVDLAGTRPAGVARAIARAMDLGEHPESTAADVLSDRMRASRLLLVLDNCEHVRDAAATLVSRLLRESPGLQILCTSREALGVPGEIDYPVRPMSVPMPGAPPERILATDAVQLFVARAREQRPSLVDDADTLATAARICTDLDGLPLAIELAAARVKGLALEDIAGRLSDRFRFLVSWRRLAVARHRTLAEAMDWSYELLGSDEQELFARLSVFAGTFTLDGVARVCLDGDAEKALPLLERLVGASLVAADERDGQMAYRLLETVRQYAAQRLDDETAGQIRRTHANFFLGVALGADLSAVRRGTEQRLDVAIDAQDNLRQALAWAVDTGAVAFGLELATSLERFWVTQDPLEGTGWFGALFARPEAEDVDPAVRANALRAYGSAADIAGDDDLARRRYEESLAIFRAIGDEAGTGVLLHRVAISAQRRGDLAAAEELVESSYRIHQRLHDRWGQAQTLGTMGAIARDAGDPERAFGRFEESLELARDLGVTWWVSGLQAELANLLLDSGRLDDGEGRARESLVLADAMGDRAGRLFGIGLLARVAAERDQTELAGRLWESVATEDGVAPLGGWRRHRDAYRVRLAARLPKESGPAGHARSATLDDAVGLALGRASIE